MVSVLKRNTFHFLTRIIANGKKKRNNCLNKMLHFFLTVYTEPPKTKAVRQICDYDTPPADGKVCNVDVNSDVWGKCTSKKNYGYSTSSPCVFLKLNRVN